MWSLWWRKWHWGRFSWSTSVSPANEHSTKFLMITQGRYNRLIGGFPYMLFRYHDFISVSHGASMSYQWPRQKLLAIPNELWGQFPWLIPPFLLSCCSLLLLHGAVFIQCIYHFTRFWHTQCFLEMEPPCIWWKLSVLCQFSSYRVQWTHATQIPSHSSSKSHILLPLLQSCQSTKALYNILLTC
jgi:hypothetical protein